MLQFQIPYRRENPVISDSVDQDQTVHFVQSDPESTLSTKGHRVCLTLSNRQILDSSKLKEFADNNFKFDKNGRKFSKRVENTEGK